MQPATSGLEQMKQKMRDTWMAGDFGQVAKYSERHAEEFVNRLRISPQMQILDVACGTGNLAIPAARKGAGVIGSDIATNLLDQARRRAAEEGLQVTFEEADAEQLPYADAQFDLVMSMFGAMFAPHPDQVAAELSRVCRSGGTLAMANWTPSGFVGETFRLGTKYVAPPEGLQPPVLWGDEKVVRERLGPYTSKIETTQRPFKMDFPFPPGDVVQFFRRYFGPIQMAFSRLDETQQAAYAVDLEKHWSDHNKGPAGQTLVDAEYLEVIAIRK